MKATRNMLSVTLALPVLLGGGLMIASPAQAAMVCYTAPNGATDCYDNGAGAQAPSVGGSTGGDSGASTGGAGSVPLPSPAPVAPQPAPAPAPISVAPAPAPQPAPVPVQQAPAPVQAPAPAPNSGPVYAPAPLQNSTRVETPSPVPGQEPRIEAAPAAGQADPNSAVSSDGIPASAPENPDNAKDNVKASGDPDVKRDSSTVDGSVAAIVHPETAAAAGIDAKASDISPLEAKRASNNEVNLPMVFTLIWMGLLIAASVAQAVIMSNAKKKALAESQEVIRLY